MNSSSNKRLNKNSMINKKLITQNMKKKIRFKNKKILKIIKKFSKILNKIFINLILKV